MKGWPASVPPRWPLAPTPFSCSFSSSMGPNRRGKSWGEKRRKKRKERKEKEENNPTPNTTRALTCQGWLLFPRLPLNEPFLSSVFKAAFHPHPNLGAFTLQTRRPPPCGNLKANKLLGSCSDTHLGICFISRLCASDLPNKSSSWISAPSPSPLPSLPC